MKLFKINENIVKLLSCEEIATYAVISNAKTKDDTCYCYEKYIADKLKISLSTAKRHVKTLSESRAFAVTSENIPDSTKRRNIYKFSNLETNFILVESSILEVNLTNSEIGLLIKLKAYCYGNSLRIYYSLNKLATELHIGKAKLSKLLKGLEEKGIITNTPEYYELNLFFKNTSKVVTKAIKERKKQLEVWNDLSNRFSICNDETGKLFKEYNLKLDSIINPAALAKSIFSGTYDKAYKKRKEKADREKARLRAEMENITL